MSRIQDEQFNKMADEAVRKLDEIRRKNVKSIQKMFDMFLDTNCLCFDFKDDTGYYHIIDTVEVRFLDINSKMIWITFKSKG